MVLRDITPPSAGVKALSDLERHAGVVRLRLPRGQVVVYRGHRAAGLFVLLRGAVALEAEEAGEAGRRAGDRVLLAHRRPVVLPPPERLDTPVDVTVRTVRDAELLFVPRSAVLEALGPLARACSVAYMTPHIRTPRSAHDPAS